MAKTQAQVPMRLYRKDGRIIECYNAVAVLSQAGIAFVMAILYGNDGLFYVQEWVPAFVYAGANRNGFIDDVAVALARNHGCGVLTADIMHGEPQG